MAPWAWSIFYFALCAYTYSRFFAHLDIYSCSCLLSGRWSTWFIPGEASNLGRWVRSGSFWYWVQTLYFIKVNYYQIMNPIKGQDGNEKNKISIWSAFRIDLEIIKGSDFSTQWSHIRSIIFIENEQTIPQTTVSPPNHQPKDEAVDRTA